MAGLNWWFACPYKEIPCFFKKMTILLREIHAIIICKNIEPNFLDT